jgi:hypothetical protein
MNLIYYKNLNHLITIIHNLLNIRNETNKKLIARKKQKIIKLLLK